MSQIHANPDELERFARELKQFNDQLASSSASLKGQFQRLGDTWRDQEQQKFAQQFEQTMRMLEQFKVASEQQTPFLLKKAQILRNFLNK